MDDDESNELQRSSTKLLQRDKLAKFKEKVDKSGIVYMSRVPPHLKPLKLRQMLEVHAQLGRIYMAPKENAPKKAKKHGASGQKQGKQFGEAWIEFKDKKQAKAVVEMLNCAPMGGKNRSRYKEDLWTLKYLPKFKWDHLTEEIGMSLDASRINYRDQAVPHLSAAAAVVTWLAEILISSVLMLRIIAAYQKAAREKLFAQELAKAKRERDFYLSKVAQAKKNEAIINRKREVSVVMQPAA